MFHYRVKIAYKGTDYRGWQTQGKLEASDARATVQGTIHLVLQKIAKYQECKIAGTSRTDAGVHAQGQRGKVSMPSEIAADKLMQGMNSLLPGDIRIMACERCLEDYNPKTCSTEKEYHYYFASGEVANPVLGDVVAHVPGPLDWQQMGEAAQLFVGEHDFYNFYRHSSQAATTVRKIISCELGQVEFPPYGTQVGVLKIRGEGFLKQMVRYIAGALFEVGRGRVSLEQVSTYLREHQGEKLSPKAKAHGLHLMVISES